MELSEIREKIDTVDDQLLKLFLERMSLAEEVAAYKNEHHLPILNKERERAVLARLWSMETEDWARLPDSGAGEGLPFRLAAAAREAGLPCSQQEVRRILAGLDRAGLVRVSRGRGGTRLTPAGRALCRRQAVEGGAEMV